MDRYRDENPLLMIPQEDGEWVLYDDAMAEIVKLKKTIDYMKKMYMDVYTGDTTIGHMQLAFKLGGQDSGNHSLSSIPLHIKDYIAAMEKNE